MANVQSVDRISNILNTIAAHHDGAGVTEIAHEIDLPVSTVSRFLLALENVNFVERVSASSGFRIGRGIVDLAARGDFTNFLMRIARPFLDEITQLTGESATLTILKDDQVYCVDQVPGQYNLQLQNWVGQYFPLHTSADGKVYLAFMPAARLDYLLSQPLPPVTSNSITDHNQLRDQVNFIRSAGFATTQGEYEDGLVAMAAPIWTTNGRVTAAIGIGAPSFRFPAEGERAEIIEKLIGAGNQISIQLQG